MAIMTATAVPPPPPPSAAAGSQPKEYLIAESTKQHGVKRIYDRLDSETKLVVELADNVPITVDFENEQKCFDIFKRDIKDLGKSDETMHAAMTELHRIITPKMEVYLLNKKLREEREAEEAANRLIAETEEEPELELRKETVCKYTPHSNLRYVDNNDVYLWECVIVQGKAKFAGYDRTKQQAIFKKDITDTWRNFQLSPNRDDSHAPFEFASDQEIQEYIIKARQATFSQLWDMIYDWVQKCYDTDDEYINTLVTAFIAFSFFFDKIGVTPYLFLYGPPITGKSALLKIIELLGYRFAQMTLTRAAGIYRLLGDVEPGQVNMYMDEMSYLDQDPLLLELLKMGYEISAKVPRNFDVTSAELASMKHFFAYCIKIFASEKLPRTYLLGGFKTRTFDVETSYGVPEIDIKEVARTRDLPEHAAIMEKIDSLRKLLFAYRLVHFGDVFPKIETKLQGRHRELAIGSLTLAYGTDKYEVVKKTFYHHISAQMEGKLDSLPVYIATLVKHLEKVVSDPANKDKPDTVLLELFQASYHEAMRKEQEEVLLELANSDNEPVKYFDTVTIDSDLIWEAIKRVLPGAEEIDYNPNRWNEYDEYDNNNENDNKNNVKSKDAKNKKFKRNTNSGKKVIQSSLFHDLSWSKSLPSVLHQIGGKPGKNVRGGKRMWVIDGKKLARFEKSYAQVIKELTSVKDEGKKVDGTKTPEAPLCGTTSSNSSEKAQESSETSSSNNGNSSSSESSIKADLGKQGTFSNDKSDSSPLDRCFRCLRCRQHSDITNDSINSTEANNSISITPGGRSQAQATILLSPPAPEGEPIQQVVPQEFAGNGTQDTLFYGHRWITWDLEWDPSTSKVYAAASIDHLNKKIVYHLSDPEFENDEGKLLDKIVEMILKYPVSFGYYSTGMFNEWSGKGQDSDLITLHRRLEANGRVSPIEIYKPPRGYGPKRPVFKDYRYHAHFDLYNVFDNEVVKNFIDVEEDGKYAYRSSKLDTVAKALTGKGKLLGLSGHKILNENVETQKEYVMQDAVLLYDILLSKIGKKTIDLLKEFAQIMNADLDWVWHSTITAWWTKIFDDIGCTRLEDTEKYDYDGALVLPCHSGYYENVVLVDVKSLYPSMAINHNVGFDSVNCSCCEYDPRARVPRWALIDPDGKLIDKTYWLCRKKVSVYRERLIIFRKLKDEADRNGQTMAKQAYKLLMNASYGAFATYGFGYLCTPVSELITGFGRFTLRVMNAVALAMGLQPIAGDTDSLFLANVKSKEQLAAYFKRCQELLRVEDPLTEQGYWNVDIENKSYDKSGKTAPVTFKRFWNVVKKHYYSIDATGKFRSVKMEVEKDDRVEYSAHVLWKQWQIDLEQGKDPMENLMRLTSDQELKTVLENKPQLLLNSQKLGENPRVIDPITGELVGCTYKKPFDPLPTVAREQGLQEGDICYYYKTGENKKILKVDEQGKALGSYTTNPKYASISKIREGIASAWMKPLKVYLGYSVPPTLKELNEKTGKKKDKIQKHMTAKELATIKEDKQVSRKIRKEVFGLER